MNSENNLYHRRFEMGPPEGVSIQIVDDIRPSEDSNVPFEFFKGLKVNENIPLQSSIQPNYNVSKLFLEYKTNQEYRKNIREIFNMKPTPENTDSDFDDETNDELDYESKKIEKTMNTLFEQTKNNVLFQILYDLAAAKMISLDRSIGQSILFSYDYLYLFHACLCVFIVSPLEFNENCEYYIQLKEKLEKR